MSAEVRFGFVILHYAAYEMSVNCAERILTLFSKDGIKIVIVDNASVNGSGASLRERYKNHASVEVLLNHQNLGFAQGNNIGYLYLKANYDCDFIIVLNNDVLIEQQDFLEKMQDIYKEKGFAVLGPDIYSPKLRDSQSPTYRRDVENLYGRKPEDVREINRRLSNFNSKRYYYQLRHMLFGWVRKFVPSKSVKERMSASRGSVDFSEDMENVVLHGACYVFSREFIKARSLAFNPDTFMYFEEDILHYECMQSGLKLLYSPRVKVTHLEDVSTDSVYGASFRKTMFVNKHLEHSTAVYLDLVAEDLLGRGGGTRV